MWQILLVIALAIVVYFAARYYLLRHSIKNVEGELNDISKHLEDNRIVRLPNPNKDLESLLVTINKTLADIRQSAIEHANREANLKAQIEHISHDLRTPLTGILGYLSLIDKVGLNEESLEALDAIERKASSLKRLIADFYELSLANAKNEPLDRQSIDIARALNETAASQYQLLEKSGLEVSISMPADPVFALANADALERILENLFQNAARYAKSFLRIRLEVKPNNVVLSFTNDTDTLIRDTQLDQLFEPFFVLDQSRNQEGSGLGLTIAKSLAESMGANLTAKALQDNGKYSISFLLNLFVV